MAQSKLKHLRWLFWFLAQRVWPIALIGASVALIDGCANIRVTDPARTASEQFLLSDAAIKAVEPLSFESLHGRTVFLDSTYFAAAEKEFVIGELRAKLLKSGVQIVAERAKAEIILEVRSGGVGIDRYEGLLGIPAIIVPGGATGAATSTPMATLITPELAIIKKIKQVGFASVACIAYWADTGEVLSGFGPFVGKSYREDWWLFGFGPSTLGTIPPVEHGVE
jgi:hypothetical protein